MYCDTNAADGAELREAPDGKVFYRGDLENMPIEDFFNALEVTREDLYYLCGLDRYDFIEDCTVPM